MEDLRNDLNSSSIELESEFSLFNTDKELEGGAFKINRDSSEYMNDTSTVDLDSNFDLSDSEMNGGAFKINRDS